MSRSLVQNPFPAPATVSGNQTISGTCSERCSIRLVTGDLTFSVNVVSVPTVGDPLEFTLFYHSRDDVYTTELGHLWRSNGMMSLTVGATLTTLVGPDGRNYPWQWDSLSSTWKQDPNSFFLPATLVDATTEWRLEFQDGRKFVFEHPASGLARLLKSIDRNGHETVFTWTSGKLTKIKEPAGREINLAYYASGSYTGFLETITDPRGKVTTLSYTGGPGSEKLWKITGPEGCVLEYLYKSGTNLIEKRKDPRLKELSFEFHGSGANLDRLWKVRDAEASPNTAELVYEYGTVPEWIADNYVSVPPPYQQDFLFTKLTDARGKVWEWRFDPSGNLWRQKDPLGRQTRHYWDSHQRLLYSTAGFPPPQLFADYLGPKDNTNNSFWRRAYDDQGNMTQSLDPSGLLTFSTYDSANRVTSVTPGLAHFGVKGRWASEFGSQGWVLCAFDSGTDRVKLPSYVNSVVSDASDPLEGQFLATDRRLLDGSAPFGRDAAVDPALGEQTGERQLAFWKPAASNPNNHFSFRVKLNGASPTSFNLSLYAHAADLASLSGASAGEPTPFSPLRHYEQYGRALKFKVTDLDGTREYPLFSDAAGVWITFPVRGHSTNDVVVQVEAMAPYNTQARLAAVAFDAAQSRTTGMQYDAWGNTTQVKNPLGETTSMSYWDPSDPTGPGFRLLKQVTDARSKATKLFYADTYKNLTRVEDPAGKSTQMTYDLNSNLLTVTDASSYVDTMTWDDRNRLLTSKNNANQMTSLGWDDAGNLESLTDPQSKVTSLTYTNMNRTATVTDDDGNQWAFTWDRAGNLLTVKDPRNNAWSMEYDDAGQLVRVNQPDTQKVDMAYDALGRVAALVTPNGTQADASVNTVGLANLLTNPGAEEQDPFDGNAAHARFWEYPGLVRSSAQHYEGGFSLQQSGTARAAHDASPAMPGVPLLARARFYIADSGWTYEAILGFAAYALDGSSTYGEQTVLPRSTGYSPGWREVGPTRFTASSLTQKPEHQLKLASYASSGVFENAWWDQVELKPLGTGYSYDPAGRPGRIERPDGSTFRIEHDRFGNVSRVVDALGRSVRFRYDGLDRLVEALTALGHAYKLTYDPVGHLATFVEPGSPGPTTGYAYDDVERLQTITYPDSSTEGFTYHDNSDLETYTDNKGQVFRFHYDTARRLWKIDDVGLSQTVEFTYGAAGFVATRKERNGDLTTLTRDDAYRVLQEIFAPGGGSSSPGWTHENTWDAAGNRRSLASAGNTDRYGVATYGTSHWGGPLWTVTDSPGDPGYDAMNRLKHFQDMDGNTTSMGYDVEGHRTRITHPNGAVTEAVHDFMGRVLSMTTLRDSSTLLQIGYGYDRNSNRVSQVSGDKTFEYRLDDDDRLVGESINCWTLKTARELRTGTLAGTDTVTTPDKLALLGWDDAFAGRTLNLDRWRPAFSQTDKPGFRVRQQDGLYLLFPDGYTTRVFGSEPPVVAPFGLTSPGAALWGGVEHRRLLSGDFTVEVDFDRLQQATAAVSSPTAVSAGTVRVGLMVNATNTEIRSGALAAMYRTVAPAGVGDVWESQIQPTSPPPTVATAAATGTSGSLRIQRSSGQLSTWFRPTGGSWTQVGATTAFTGDNLRVALLLETTYAPGTVRFTEFRETVQNNWPASATWESPIYDSGQAGVAWDKLSWTENLPANTDVTIDVATQNSAPFGAWSYSGGYTDPSGSSLSGRTGRYLRFRVTMTNTGAAASPEVSKIRLTFGTGWQDRDYGFDGRGNMTSKIVVTSAGTVTETRTVNILNQVTQNAVVDTAAGTTTTWLFSYDLNGNRTQKKKSDDSEIWDYTWNRDNRLTRVVKTVSSVVTLDVAYSYDSLGRMLTRKLSTDANPTVFEWDGWDLVREVDPAGVETVYFVPQGEILSFKRGSSVYQVHADALGSVRSVTDSIGMKVAEFNTDAWGQTLNTSGSLASSFQPRFIGALGVRLDPETSLYYMRNRWYDPVTERFISRDFVRASPNRYPYARNNPVRLIDRSGRDWEDMHERERSSPSGLTQEQAEQLDRAAAEYARHVEQVQQRRVQSGIDLLERYVRARRPDFGLYLRKLKGARLRGNRWSLPGWFGLFTGASAETVHDSCGGAVNVNPLEMNLYYGPDWVAQNLLHEGVHLTQPGDLLWQITHDRETEAYAVVNQAVKDDISDFWNHLPPEVQRQIAPPDLYPPDLRPPGGK